MSTVIERFLNTVIKNANCKDYLAATAHSYVDSQILKYKMITTIVLKSEVANIAD